jgi:hypothetical protein
MVVRVKILNRSLEHQLQLRLLISLPNGALPLEISVNRCMLDWSGLS